MLAIRTADPKPSKQVRLVIAVTPYPRNPAAINPLAPTASTDTGEVDGAGRVQKFLRYRPTARSGTGSAEVGKYIK